MPEKSEMPPERKNIQDDFYPVAARIEPEKSVLAEIPPLQNGDHLSREEFERRWENMPELEKAELIDGVVYLPSPIYHKDHGAPNFNLIAWLGYYRIHTPGVEGGASSSIRMDWKSMPQPDAFLYILPARGGQVKSDDGKYLEGSPEFNVEIAATSASHDLHAKKEAYRRNDVREYLVWRTLDGQVDWFFLKEGQYENLLPDMDGTLKSRIFPGLWLHTAALLQGDMKLVIAVLEKGLATPEHQAFAERLARCAAKKS